MDTTEHEFVPSGPDDTCADCGVTVTSMTVVATFSVPCPAGDCPSPKNPDTGCVFAPAPQVDSRCIFCGRPGGTPDDLYDADNPWED